MWTTRCWKVTLLCGWLAAPLAGAMEPEDETPYSEAAPRDMQEPVELSGQYEDGPDSLDAPRLRMAEPLSCPAVPEGRMWVADTEECGDSECIRKTTVWIGSWTIEDAEMQVRCETDRVILSTADWELVLQQDATGQLALEDPASPEPEAAPAELAGEVPQAPATET